MMNSVRSFLVFEIPRYWSGIIEVSCAVFAEAFGTHGRSPSLRQFLA